MCPCRETQTVWSGSSELLCRLEASVARAEGAVLIAASDPKLVSEVEFAKVMADDSSLWLSVHAKGPRSVGLGQLPPRASKRRPAPTLGCARSILRPRVHVAPPPGPLAACPNQTSFPAADSGLPESDVVVADPVTNVDSELELKRSLANAGLDVDSSSARRVQRRREPALSNLLVRSGLERSQQLWPLRLLAPGRRKRAAQDPRRRARFSAALADRPGARRRTAGDGGGRGPERICRHLLRGRRALGLWLGARELAAGERRSLVSRSSGLAYVVRRNFCACRSAELRQGRVGRQCPPTRCRPGSPVSLVRLVERRGRHTSCRAEPAPRATRSGHGFRHHALRAGNDQRATFGHGAATRDDASGPLAPGARNRSERRGDHGRGRSRRW